MAKVNTNLLGLAFLFGMIILLCSPSYAQQDANSPQEPNWNRFKDKPGRLLSKVIRKLAQLMAWEQYLLMLWSSQTRRQVNVRWAL